MLFPLVSLAEALPGRRFPPSITARSRTIPFSGMVTTQHPHRACANWSNLLSGGVSPFLAHSRGSVMGAPQPGHFHILGVAANRGVPPFEYPFSTL